MNNTDIQQRVRRVVSRILKVDEEMIRPDSHFVFDLGAESVQAVQLVAAFEAEFDIEMDNEAALKVKTVEGAVDFIRGYLTQRPREQAAR